MRFYTEQHRFYCGVDLHARSMYLCILNHQGQVVYDKNPPARADNFLAAIEPFRDGLVVGVEFLTDLAVRGRVSASTQNQALNALVFLYKQVLEIELGRFDAVRARRPQRLPVVLAPEEVARVLERIEGTGGLFQVMARLLYGSGPRLIECCRLRVKDMNLERSQILVRAGKGNKDRVVMLPRSVRDDVERQLEAWRRLYERDLTRSVARVDLPDALESKYPRAAQEFGWQFLFASR
jgi:integrase